MQRGSCSNWQDISTTEAADVRCCKIATTLMDPADQSSECNHLFRTVTRVARHPRDALELLLRAGCYPRVEQRAGPMKAIASGKSSWARATGSVYLLYFLTAVAGQTMVSRGFALPGKATNFVSVLLYIVLGILLYRLFRPAGNALSLVAALFNFAGSAVTLLALFPGGRLHVSPLLFFGMYCLLIGVLILRSAFLPHALGLLTASAGIGWFVFLLPLRIHFLTVLIEVFGFIAEAALMVWLLVKGVDEQKWAEEAAGQRQVSVPNLRA